MKKKNLLLLILPIVAIILETNPNGVTMNWGMRMEDGSMGFIQKHCAFFNPIAAAYGDVAPFLTAVLTVLLLAVCIVSVFTKKINLMVKIVSILAFAASAAALATARFVLDYSSVAGIAIAISLGLEALLVFFLLSAKSASSHT